VALNWLRARGVIPLCGARTAAQLRENLGCLEHSLPPAAVQRLDQVSRIALGYPHDFLASGMVRHHTYGGMFQAIDNHRG
jgi:diketogulonate reductase-like aldo/keto reductase